MIDLNKDLINRCNNQSMYNRGNHIQDDAEQDYKKFIEHYSKQNLTNKQLEILERRKENFKELLSSCYNDYLNSSANFVPVNVAGPAKYPSAKMDKVMNSIQKKLENMEYKIDRFYKNTDEMLKNAYTREEIISLYRNGYKEPISSDDPLAKEKLQAKLEFLEEKHQSYKDYNKKARANGQQQLAPYVLTNSNQNIKSVKERLLQIEKMENADLHNYYFDEGQIYFDKVDNRVKVFFNEKPDESMRNELKSHGFKWAPTNKCWQRKLTSDSIYTTHKMFKNVLTIGLVPNKLEEKEITML